MTWENARNRQPGRSGRSGQPRPRRRSWLRPTLFTMFVVVPLVEIWVLVQVGQVIGAGWTIAVLVADSLLGVWLVRREGRRAWDAFVGAQRAGQIPGREIADGALILVGGTLLLTPGFVTDLLGFALLLPPSRALARGAVTAMVLRRLRGVWGGVVPGGIGGATGSSRRRPNPGGSGGPGGSGQAQPGHGPSDTGRPGSPPPSGHGPVIPGEVIRDGDRPQTD